jgi:hypothetical protein
MDSPAFRLLRVLERTAKVQQNDTFAAWAEVLEIRTDDVTHRDRQIMERLAALQDQMAQVRAQLNALPDSIEASSYDKSLRKIQEALSPQRFREPWKNMATRLNSETLGILRVLAQFLPKDVANLSSDELGALASEIEALSSRIREGSLSAEAKRFFLDQLGILLRAIQEYPFRGPDAFHQASLEAHLSWIADAPSLSSAAEQHQASDIRQLWGRIVQFGKRAALVHVFVAGLIQTGDAALGGRTLLRGSA